MRRADRDVDAVVLGELRELRVQPVRARDHRGRHPVDPPHQARAAQTGQDLVDRAGEMPEGHLLTEHGAEPARVRQHADEDVSGLLPRRDGQLEPVPLDLLARGVIDLRCRRPAAPLLADQAHRPQPGPPQLPHQRRIRAVEPSRGQLVQERHGREVRVIDEPGGDIRPPRLQAARGPLPDQRSPPAARYLRTVLRSRPVCRLIAD